MKKKTIFIHSLFRTGSTYIWNKFRQNTNYCCYYEPLHQILSEINSGNIDIALTRDYNSVKHPVLENHYLEEYKSLLGKEEGIPFFKKEFSFDQFCYNENNVDLKKYLDNLIEKADGKTSVLQFNRTALRSSWFKKNYPESLNLYILRNPRDQFNSYSELKQRTGTDIFFLMDILIAGKNNKEKKFEGLSKHIELINYQSNSVEEDIFFYSNAILHYSESEKYFIFYYIWLMSLIENIDNADRLININLLSTKTIYREQFKIYLENLDIRGFDFSDSNIKSYDNYNLPVSDLNMIETEVNKLVLDSLNAEVKSKLRKYIKDDNIDFLSALVKNDNEKKISTKRIKKNIYIKKDKLLQNIGKIGFLFKKGTESHNTNKTIEIILKKWDNQYKKELELNKIREDFEKLKDKFKLEKKTGQFKFELLLSQIKGKEDQINLKQIEYQKIYSELESSRRELELQRLNYNQLETELTEKKNDILEISKKNDHLFEENNINFKIIKEHNKRNSSYLEKIKMLKFENSKKLAEAKVFENKNKIILKSNSYRIGRLITLPVRKIKMIFKRQKYKINRIAFIDHSFHEKSKATQFLIKILREKYDVELCWDKSWNSGSKIDIKNLLKRGFDTYIFFQIIHYPEEEIQLLNNKNLIVIPMLDGSNVPNNYWKKFKYAKFINFSKMLHHRLKNLGYKSIYVQYFPNPDNFNRKKVNSTRLKGFFWQRTDQITWNHVQQIIGKSKFSDLHFHCATDPPGFEVILPDKNELKKTNITTSNWFENQDAYLELTGNYNIYFAPRLYEGIGMSFIEAMCQGKCVVAPDNPTMNEYIEHGKTGLLYNHCDPEPLDFNNVKEICNNAISYTQSGYQKWKKQEVDMIDFIQSAVIRQNRSILFYRALKFKLKSLIKKIINKFNLNFDRSR